MTPALPTIIAPAMIEFTYVVWVGQNRSEVYSMDMQIPINTSFYEAMKIAAENNPHYVSVYSCKIKSHSANKILNLAHTFRFTATVWPNGHLITSIGGWADQYIGFHHWLLFRIPVKPDPFNPPLAVVPNVAPGGYFESI